MVVLAELTASEQVDPTVERRRLRVVLSVGKGCFDRSTSQRADDHLIARGVGGGQAAHQDETPGTERRAAGILQGGGEAVQPPVDEVWIDRADPDCAVPVVWSVPCRRRGGPGPAARGDCNRARGPDGWSQTLSQRCRDPGRLAT